MAIDHAPAVLVRDVSVRRGRADVVADVSIGLRPGSVTGLLGSSGCGKTSLMRALVGVQQRVRGELRVLGEPAGTPALRAGVGYLTQAPSIYADLTVRENRSTSRACSTRRAGASTRCSSASGWRASPTSWS